MRNFLQSLSIKAIVTITLILFALLLGIVAVLGYASSEMSNGAITDRTRTATRIELLSQTDRLRLRTSLLLRGYATAGNGESGVHSDKPKQQAAVQDMFKATYKSLADFRAMPPVSTEEGRRLMEVAVTAFVETLEALDRQYQAWVKEDFEAYYKAEEVLRVKHGPQIFKAIEEASAHLKLRGDQQLADYHSSLKGFAIIGGISMIVALFLMLALRALLMGFVVRPVTEAVGYVQRLARADLSQPIPVTSGNEIGQLQAAMREMQESLVRIVGSVRAGSGSILVGAQQIAGGNADLSSRTEQQAASLEETAASMEELTATVKQNADNARQASALANDASGTAGQGREVVGRVVETMREISDSSQQIARIVGVIDSIAFQTNILALNASVEAARAGEQGRGFAVVAGEVRNLAGRSAEAAREIKALIEASSKRVGDGSQLVEQAGWTMEGVVKAVQRVTDIIDEISAASHEQSEGIAQVNTAIAQMDEVTQQNAALVQEASAASSSLAEQARHLEEAVAVFRLSAEQQRAQPQEGRGERRAAPQPAQARRAEKHPLSPAKERARPAATVAEEQWEEF
ncbi:HAMP domain-containing protein [Azotobacter chroococcum]|uniref:methyl-accepting chemotaxis protein n=1 Tax=Azotobacter chroococcum TaxID=353 RepID=UPI001040DBA2|nr:methyl-accepting chemotaxis protein [Azotobacter chroococcum]TBW31865.1 HAMP domain-containing protein [Azotobacter chroococcum]